MNRVSISIPKSGTHLLKHILDLEGDFNYVDLKYYAEPTGFAEVKQRCRRYPNGFSGHIHHCYGARGLMDHNCVCFLRRHPGDIIVSWYHYMLVAPPTSFVYLTFPASVYDKPVEEYEDVWMFLIDHIHHLIRAFMGWMDEPVHQLKYEDLLHRPEEVLKPVAEDLGEPLDVLVRRSRFRGGETFRKGKTGKWKKEIVGKYYDHFKELYSDIAEEMGYLI